MNEGNIVTMQRQLIGLTGGAGTGKSTLASFLIDDGYVECQMASGVKTIVSGIVPAFTREILEGSDASTRVLKETLIDPVTGWTPRKAMQTVATMFREYDQDFWMKQAECRIRGMLDAGESVVVPDIRFRNEFDMVRRLGGKVYLLTRDGSPIVDKGHISERSFAEFTDEVDGTFDLFRLNFEQLRQL